MPNICLSHDQQPGLEVSAAGSSGFQSFTPSVQGVAHVDCGQWLCSGLGPIQPPWLGPVADAGSPPAQGCCWPNCRWVTVTSGWEGNTCRQHCSFEFFPLWMSRDSRQRRRQAGLAHLAFSSHPLQVWHPLWMCNDQWGTMEGEEETSSRVLPSQPSRDVCARCACCQPACALGAVCILPDTVLLFQHWSFL